VVLGWGYSAPPLRLNSRGLGELTVALCFALLPLGVLQVLQAPAPAGLPWLAAGYGVAAALLLFANQFPDRQADALAGKRHWVVRLSHPAAVRGYLLLAGLAVTLPLLAGQPWLLCLLPLYLRAWRALQQQQLRAAIIPTIMAANLYPLLLAASLWLRPTL
jgi:1,4-dihydroxy-2-naphthoate octaprenyltransferase